MKKDRVCGAMPYPVYPNAPAMMPIGPTQMMPMGPTQMMPGQMFNPMPQMMDSTMTSDSMDQMSLINNKITALENRVSNLEKTIKTSPNYGAYNTSNFQMM